MPRERKYVVYVGDVFGKLTTLVCLGYERGKHEIWACKCECGRFVLVQRHAFFGQNPRKSCRCATVDRNKRNAKHGMSGTRVYKIWMAMVWRCTKPTYGDYPRYGGRGIKVCERWMDFRNFFADMGEPPEGYSINRIDNNGNYEPSNCEWSSTAVQNRNRRNSLVIHYKGKRYVAAELSRALGMSESTLYYWIRVHGIEKAIQIAESKNTDRHIGVPGFVRVIDYQGQQYRPCALAKILEVNSWTFCRWIRKDGVEKAILRAEAKRTV